MIDWGLVATVAGGGFGTTIAVLVILLLVVWIVGLVMQKSQAKGKEGSGKE